MLCSSCGFGESSESSLGKRDFKINIVKVLCRLQEGEKGEGLMLSPGGIFNLGSIIEYFIYNLELLLWFVIASNGRNLGNNIYPEKKSWTPFPAKTRSDNSARIALTVRRAMLEPAITASTTPVVPTTFPNSGHSISLTSSATPASSSSAFDLSSFLDAIISRISAATSTAFLSSAAPSSLFSARFSAAPPLFSWAEKRQRRTVAFCRSDSGAGIRRAGTINGRLKFFRGDGGLEARKREKEMEAAMDLPGESD
ncbi:hypothetical protein IEQ34_010152 [Dendrobium chrysotoxum]|uniref:Uncharacterized protein n=1 Tax=Dendrobium chrysotoxum TaxID=161865 RepID=A0AAV7H2S8_DENCH|nr:hypothetical protein IEQ34_010152 [Dendrobium chrysotoxum]